MILSRAGPKCPLKVSVFLFVSSLCFARHHHLQAARSSDQENFLVPPNVLLSLLLLLRHHLQPLAAKNELDPGLKATIQQLQLFTQEAIWRIFISLKDIAFNSLCSTCICAQLSLTRDAGCLSGVSCTASGFVMIVHSVLGPFREGLLHLFSACSAYGWCGSGGYAQGGG